MIRTLLVSTALCHSLLASGAAPSANEIMERTIERAQTNHAPRAEYLYNKSTLTESLDSRGQADTKKEKIYLIRGGKAYLQEMKINGKPVPQSELAKEERTIHQARQEVTESRSSQRDENWERFLTHDLMAKYIFTLAGTESVNGRAAYVITFRPQRSELPVRNMADRVLNRLAGKIWVDVAEHEISKADISLQSPASLGGLLKVIGALKRLDYSVERVRFTDGTWFNAATRGDFESRKLWDSNRTRITSRSYGFSRHQSAQTDP